MLRRRSFPLMILGSALVLATAWPCHAAEPQKKKEPPKLYRGKGTIDSIAHGELKVTPAKGEPLTMTLSKNAEIRVTGTAQRTFLQPGQHVRFSGIASRKLKRLMENQEIKKITVFSPWREMVDGLINDPVAKTPEAKSDKDFAAEWKAYVIGGQVLSLRGNVLMMKVQDLSPRLKVELPEDLAIEVNFDDVGLLKAGDTINVELGRVGDDGVIHVDKAVFHLTAPLEKPAKADKGRLRGARKP